LRSRSCANSFWEFLFGTNRIFWLNRRTHQHVGFHRWLQFLLSYHFRFCDNFRLLSLNCRRDDHIRAKKQLVQRTTKTEQRALFMSPDATLPTTKGSKFPNPLIPTTISWTESRSAYSAIESMIEDCVSMNSVLTDTIWLRAISLILSIDSRALFFMFSTSLLCIGKPTATS